MSESFFVLDDRARGDWKPSEDELPEFYLEHDNHWLS